MSTDFALPTSKATKDSSRVSAANIQGYLGTPTSQLGHRIRFPTQDGDLGEKMYNTLDYYSPAEEYSWSTRLLRNILSCFPMSVQVFAKRLSWLRWLFILYTGMSCLFFSSAICSAYYGHLSTSSSVDSAVSFSHPLGELPMDHLVSKITSIYPSPRALEPYIIKASIDPATVTACLWATDQDIHMVLAWASRWTGPISLVLTTTAEPSSEQHGVLLRRLSAIQTHSALLNSTLSVHILHLEHPPGGSRGTAPANPNALLNLARLFAQTSRVVLFPANLSTAPPKTLYHSLVSTPHTSSLSIVKPKASTSRPMVLTSRGQNGFPFAPLAPVVLGRDDPLWCTERFFVKPASEDPGSAVRATDWEECLWQIWLENYGDVEVRPTRGWLHDTFTLASISDSAAGTKLRRRLVAKYRSETCVLATRRLAALRSGDRNLDTKKARWLKRVCRVWTNGSA